MANTVANVTQAKPKVGGAIFIAPAGTTLPTSALADLADTFTCVGYVSDSGVTHTTNISTTTIKAWGGDPVLTTQDSRDETFKFKLLESLNVNVNKLIYGDSNVSGTLATGMTASASNDAQEARVYVIDTVLKGNNVRRLVIPSGVITSIGDVVYKDNEVVAYDLTITGNTDSAGKTHYEYTQTKNTSS